MFKIYKNQNKLILNLGALLNQIENKEWYRHWSLCLLISGFSSEVTMSVYMKGFSYLKSMSDMIKKDKKNQVISSDHSTSSLPLLILFRPSVSWLSNWTAKRIQVLNRVSHQFRSATFVNNLVIFSLVQVQFTVWFIILC